MSNPPDPSSDPEPYGIWHVRVDPVLSIDDFVASKSNASAKVEAGYLTNASTDTNKNTPRLSISHRTPLNAFLTTYGAHSVRIDELTWDVRGEGATSVHRRGVFVGTLVGDEETWALLNEGMMRDVGNEVLGPGSWPRVLGRLTMVKVDPQRNVARWWNPYPQGGRFESFLILILCVLVWVGAFWVGSFLSTWVCEIVYKFFK